jgi:hypothetical protein
MKCDVYQSLMEDAGRAGEGYSRAMQAMAKNHGLPRVEFMALWKLVESERQKSESANAAVEQHIREHGCLTST